MINKLGLQDHKDDLIAGATSGRTTSRADLSHGEAAGLIQRLKAMDPDEASADKMRKKIISRAREMGWTKDGRIDMDRLNAWTTKYGHAHKPMDSYNHMELPSLVTQMDSVYRSYLKGL